MRYVTMPRRRPRASTFYDLQETPLLEATTVYEPDEPIDTGVLDQHGDTYFRIMSPIGFTEMKER